MKRSTRGGEVRRHRHRTVAVSRTVAVLLAIVASGCFRETPRAAHVFSDLEGRLFYDEPFLVVPNRAWWREKEDDVWFFGHSAALICHVNATPAEPIVFGFVPRDARSELDLELLWNGQDVTDRSFRHESGELRVEIPAQWLHAGTHFLTLRQRGASGQEGETFHFFRYIGYRVGGKPHVLETRRFYNYRYVSSLLTFGLTGSFDRQLLGGFVSHGPRSLEVDLGTEAGGLLQTRIQNSGAGRAVFRLRWESEKAGEPGESGVPGESAEPGLTVELEPHERRHVRLEIPRRVGSVELSVEGEANGYYLWGAPHFQPGRVEALTPIVLVTLDTTRRDVLGAYGGGAAVTPHLDALAAAATVFENAYTTAPWTLPAHASIFTGLYPSKHGAGLVGDHLEIGFDTLAELLRRRGYVTAGYAGGLLSSAHFGIGQGFASYRDVESFETPADQLTDHGLRFLDEFVDGTRAPFFLFLNYFDPHFPYRAPERFQAAMDVAARRRAVGGDAVWQSVLDGSNEAWERVVDREVAPNPEALAALEAAYRAEVAFMDEYLGRFLDGLRERDLYDRTLIVIAADHGELLGENGYFSHSGRLVSELVEIPLIVKWPQQRKGKRDARLVSLVDLFPTLLETAGVPTDGLAVDGLALRRNGDGRRFDERLFVAAEEHDTDFHRLPPALRVADDLFAALGHRERHLSWGTGETCYRRDGNAWRPEQCNGSRRIEIARQLRRRLEDAAHRPHSDRIGLTRRERRELRALGYLR